MSRLFPIVLSTLACTLAPTTRAFGADDVWEKFDLAKVAPNVRKTARQWAPKLKFTEAFHQTSGTSDFYKLVGKDAQELENSVTVSGEGDILRLETEIRATDVPKPVAAALKTSRDESLKEFKPTKIVKDVSNPNIKPPFIGYFFYGKNPDGEEIRVRITPDGKKVVVRLVD